MKSFKITTLPGDGIGPEVMNAALAVLDVVGNEYDLNFKIITELAGGASFDQYNEPITESALQSCLESRSEEHTSELQSQAYLVCRLLLEKKKKKLKQRKKKK